MILVIIIIAGLLGASVLKSLGDSQKKTVGPTVSNFIYAGRSRPDAFPDSQHVREQSQIVFGAPSVFNPPGQVKQPIPQGQGGFGSTATGGGSAGGHGGFVGSGGGRGPNIN